MSSWTLSKASLIKTGLVLAVLSGVAWWHSSAAEKFPKKDTLSAGNPALAVVTTSLKPVQWQQKLNANGSVFAWQEAIVGSEVAGVRITEVRVSVGDQVKKGQVLANLSVDTLQANEAESQAMVRESEALLIDASANAARMRKLSEAGFVSAQQAGLAITSENAARAKLDAQKARLKVSVQRLAQQNIVAPDSGVISARTATVGLITQPGLELFRLIRQGRLEWRAELTADELAQVRKGMKVELVTAQARVVQGVVRAISPAINPQTRYGQVLVDLPNDSGLVAGMFTKGTILLDEQLKASWALPQSAVVMRDGAAYVFVVKADAHVAERKVVTGRRLATQVEILAGLEQGVQVVESGSAFLVEGDMVRMTGTAK